jgi:translocation and assembly module TamA
MMLNALSHIAPARDRSRLRLRAVALLTLLPVILPVAAVGVPQPAAAFEIFGLKLFEKEEGTIPVVNPLNFQVSLELRGGDNPDLREKLESASALMREADKPVPGSVGLISRTRSDFEQLVGVLYEDGRYGGVVKVTLAGKPLETLPPDADLKPFEPVPVVFIVEPGPQFTFGNVAVRREDGAELNPADYGIEPGETAYSTEVINAEERVVEAMRQLGRPLAKVAGRDIVADHDNNRLDVTITVSAGPVAPFGPTTVDGTEDVDRDFVAYMTGIEPGETYDPDELDAAEKRLKALEVFSSVTVRGADSLDENGAVPVDVNVAERKFRYLGLGATFSSIDGGGLEGYWGHRNLFGRAEKLRIEGSVSGIGSTSEYADLAYHGAILFEKPGVIGPASTFTSSLSVDQENPDAYRRFSVTGAAGVKYQLTEKQTLSGGVELEYARLTDAFVTNKKTLTAAVPLEWVYDGRDDKLDPKSGFRLLAHLEPAYEFNEGNAFVTVKGEASAYRALDEAKRFVVAGRVAGGSILGTGNLADVPANRRFYSGGGGSVRGYAYQGIGPKDFNGDPIGGLSYMEANAELRIGVTDKIGIVPFLDVGAVSAGSALEDAEFKAGAGVGLRYKTPFGPLRVDVAVPLNPGPGDPDYGIYAGIGQAF